jgi:GYF domain 2
MSNRSWFFASQGKQQGPYPEAQLGEFIASGTVTAETLVWTEGMAGWQKAGDIPGLFSGISGPPAVSGGPLTSAGGYGGGPLSIEFGIWEFTWRSVVLWIGLVFVIPVPWVITMYCRWIVSCVRVPQRPNLVFTGRPVTLMWYFAALVLLFCVALVGSQLLNLAMIVVQMLLYWLLIKWFVANISSNGQALALSFSGSFWGYLGWNILAFVSIFTIIGWAWVYTAQMRWMCRHVEGTRREILFNATGLEFLWRSLVTGLGCIFIVTIPWVMRWFIRWQVSQVVLVERGRLANA